MALLFSGTDRPGPLSCKEVFDNSTEWKPGKIKVVGRRCGCGGSFCPACGKQAVQRGVGKLRKLEWQRVRAVDLTLDPKKYPDPEAAYHAMEKEVGYFIDRLRRSGVLVTRWVCFLEWHLSGLPHFHVFIEVEQAGRAGMIGYDRLQACWAHGFVREWPVKSEAHWKNLLGYAGKTGYLHKAKRHQVTLPAWGLASKAKIRRVHGSQASKANPDPWGGPDHFSEWMRKYGNKWDDSAVTTVDQSGKADQQTNGERLAGCGLETYIYYAPRDCSVSYQGKVGISFAAFKGMGASYQDGLGWYIYLSASDLLEFHRLHFWGNGAGIEGRRPARVPSSRGRRAAAGSEDVAEPSR